jgi:hypothetical protein
MAYTTINKGSSYFNTILYTGTGVSNSLTGVGFQPDWVWIKKRNGAVGHRLYDAVRGVQNTLYSSDSAAEATGQTTTLTAFNSDGFTVISESGVNASGDTYVAWNWLANNTSGSSNTAGTITSTVATNTTAGFSIVKYTGTGVNATIGHGLGVAPAMVIIKDRDTVVNWSVNHQPLCASLGDYTRYLVLDAASVVSGPGNTQYQNTPFTSTVFNVGTNTTTNNNTKNFIAYCFASIKGFSKIGIYTGNGSADGTFVYTGFKPALVVIKNTTHANNWIMLDNKRGPYNLQSTTLYPNTSDAETSTTTNFGMDFLSNGMKMRTSGDYNTNSNNSSGDTYIYMAFAENPFVTSTQIPTTAR